MCVLSNPKLIFAVKNSYWPRRAIFISGRPVAMGFPAKSLNPVNHYYKLRESIRPLTIIVLNTKYARLNVNNAKLCACEFMVKPLLAPYWMDGH